MLGELQLSAARRLSDNYQSLCRKPSLNGPGVSSELVICVFPLYVCNVQRDWLCAIQRFEMLCNELLIVQKQNNLVAVIACVYE